MGEEEHHQRRQRSILGFAGFVSASSPWSQAPRLTSETIVHREMIVQTGHASWGRVYDKVKSWHIANSALLCASSDGGVVVYLLSTRKGYRGLVKKASLNLNHWRRISSVFDVKLKTAYDIIVFASVYLLPQSRSRKPVLARLTPTGQYFREYVIPETQTPTSMVLSETMIWRPEYQASTIKVPCSVGWSLAN